MLFKPLAGQLIATKFDRSKISLLQGIYIGIWQFKIRVEFTLFIYKKLDDWIFLKHILAIEFTQNTNFPTWRTIISTVSTSPYIHYCVRIITAQTKGQSVFTFVLEIAKIKWPNSSKH